MASRCDAKVLDVEPPPRSPFFASGPLVADTSASAQSQPLPQRVSTSRYSAPDDDDDDDKEEDGDEEEAAAPAATSAAAAAEEEATSDEGGALDVHGTFLESWSAPAEPEPAVVSVAAAAVRVPEAVPGGGDSATEIVWRTRRAGYEEARSFAESQRRMLYDEERRRHEKAAAALAEQAARLSEELRRILTADPAAIAVAHSAELAKTEALLEEECKQDAAAVAAAKRRLRTVLEGTEQSPSQPQQSARAAKPVEICLGRGPPVAQLLQKPETDSEVAAATAQGKTKPAPATTTTALAHGLAQQQTRETEFKTPQPLQRRNSGISAASAHTALEAQRAAQTLVSTFTHASHIPSVASIAQKASKSAQQQSPEQQEQRVVKTAPFLAPTPPVATSPFSLSPAQSPVHTPSYVPVPSLLPTPTAQRPTPQLAALQITEASPAASPTATRTVPEAPAVAPLPTPEVVPSPVDVQRSNPPSPTPQSPSRPPPSPFVLHHDRAPTISGFTPPSSTVSQTGAASAVAVSPQPSAEPSTRQQVTPVPTSAGSPFMLNRAAPLPPSLSLSTRVKLPTPPPASQPAFVFSPQQQQQQTPSPFAHGDRTSPSHQATTVLQPKPTLQPAPQAGTALELSTRASSQPMPPPAAAHLATTKTGIDAVLANAEGSEAALREAAHSAEVLRRVGDAGGIEPRITNDYKKRIRLAVNQISADEQQVARKVEELSTLLNEVRATPALHKWCLRELARCIVTQGDDQVAQFQGSAFCIAAVAVGIAARFPDFSDVLVASFHEACL